MPTWSADTRGRLVLRPGTDRKRTCFCGFKRSVDVSWYEERFDECAGRGRVRCECIECFRPMFFPPSKVGLYKTCGGKCSDARVQAVVADRERVCLTCGNPFLPRRTQLRKGQGQYCCVACGLRGTAAARAPSARRISDSLRAAYASGMRTAQPRGEKHPQWTGGKAAWRRKNAARSLATGRRWRLANPDKVREIVGKRRGVGRLPRGTVARIGASQRWRCAVCRRSVRNGYHLDHVYPLARGGRHEPGNLQLLCPHCNLTKNAKDPIAFMQSLGFLL